MASDQNFVNFVTEQIRNVGTITTKKMFGEYGVYCDGKLFGVICDNKLFIKPTIQGRQFIGNPTELPAYEGAKPSFVIDDKIEDSIWLSDLVKVTTDNLPEQKVKNRKK